MRRLSKACVLFLVCATFVGCSTMQKGHQKVVDIMGFTGGAISGATSALYDGAGDGAAAVGNAVGAALVSLVKGPETESDTK